MSKTIFVNLPVNDVKLAREFYTKIGFTVKEEYSGDEAVCMLFDEFGFMLVSEGFFKENIERDIADTAKTAEVVVAFTLESREAVDDMLAAAKNAGASWTRDAAEEMGMYAASFRDPFGHQFAVHAMD